MMMPPNNTFTYLPQGYKQKIHWRIKAGVAKTGQVDRKGWVKQGEHWNGELDGTVGGMTPIKLNLEEWLREHGWAFDVIDGLVIPKNASPEVRQLLIPGFKKKA